MSRLTPILLLVAGLVLPVSLSAQEFAGKWEMTRETPRGTFTQVLTLTRGEDGYTGTMSMMEREIALEKVEVEGNTITFTMTFGGRGGGGGGMSQTFTGTLEGDEIKGEMEGPRGTSPVTLTRVKD